MWRERRVCWGVNGHGRWDRAEMNYPWRSGKARSRGTHLLRARSPLKVQFAKHMQLHGHTVGRKILIGKKSTETYAD